MNKKNEDLQKQKYPFLMQINTNLQETIANLEEEPKSSLNPLPSTMKMSTLKNKRRPRIKDQSSF